MTKCKPRDAECHGDTVAGRRSSARPPPSGGLTSAVLSLLVIFGISIVIVIGVLVITVGIFLVSSLLGFSVCCFFIWSITVWECIR